jgi:hypothetical protein
MSTVDEINAKVQFLKGLDKEIGNNMADQIQLAKIEFIVERTLAAVKTRRDNAGFSGGWGDDGASALELKLLIWLDGIIFAHGGKTDQFDSLIYDFEEIQKAKQLENDPDYIQLKQLEEKLKAKGLL